MFIYPEGIDACVQTHGYGSGATPSKGNVPSCLKQVQHGYLTCRDFPNRWALNLVQSKIPVYEYDAK